MKPSIILWAGLLVILFSSLALAGAGLGLPHIDLRTIIFEPGGVHEWSYNAYGADYLEISVGGALAEYAEVDDPNPTGGPRGFTFKLTLPETLEAGEYETWVKVMEASPTGATMGGRAAVKGLVIVRSLYDIPYLKAQLAVDNTAHDFNTIGHLTLTSWSTVPIPGVFADIKVMNGDEEAFSVRSKSIDLAPSAKETIEIVLPTASLQQGNYVAEAVVTYAENTTTANAKFKIGALDFRLLEYSKELTAGETNRFTFTVESDWKDNVDDVYGIVNILGLSEQTPNVDVRPFQKQELKTYLDVQDAVPGLANGTITLFFADQEKEFPISVDVVNEETLAAKMNKEESDEKKAEAGFNMLILLYVGLVILILVNVFLLFFRGKGGQKNAVSPDVK